MQASTYRLVPLRNRGVVVGYAKVAAQDYEWVSRWSWRLSPQGYAARGGGVLMHREILGLRRGDGRFADHANRDRLDNRRSNLREISRSGNAQNSGTPARGLPRGVYRHASGRLQVVIAVGGVRHHLGTFSRVTGADNAAKAFRAEHMPYSADATEREDEVRQIAKSRAGFRVSVENVL